MQKKNVPDTRHKYEDPPFWLRLPFYLAVGGHEHFYDYRISLQSRYLKKQRDAGLPAARRLAKKEATTYWYAAGERLFWPALRLISYVMKWFTSGAS